MTIVLLVSQAGNVGKTTFAKKVVTELKKRNKKLKWVIINLRMFPTTPRIRTGATNPWVGKVGGEYVKHLSDLGWLVFVEGHTNLLRYFSAEADYIVWFDLPIEIGFEGFMKREDDDFHYPHKTKTWKWYLKYGAQPREKVELILKRVKHKHLFIISKPEERDTKVNEFAELLAKEMGI